MDRQGELATFSLAKYLAEIDIYECPHFLGTSMYVKVCTDTVLWREREREIHYICINKEYYSEIRELPVAV